MVAHRAAHARRAAPAAMAADARQDLGARPAGAPAAVRGRRAPIAYGARGPVRAPLRMPRKRRLLRYELLITCEHGGNAVPERYRGAFAGAARALASHRGYDPGAL